MTNSPAYGLNLGFKTNFFDVISSNLVKPLKFFPHVTNESRVPYLGQSIRGSQGNKRSTQPWIRGT